MHCTPVYFNRHKVDQYDPAFERHRTNLYRFPPPINPRGEQVPVNPAPQAMEPPPTEVKVERKLKLPPITDAATANLQLKESMAQRINTAIGSATMQLSRTATIHCAKERDANELRDFMIRYTKYVPAIKEKQYDEKAHMSERYLADTTPFAVVFEIPEVPEEELIAEQEKTDAEEKKRMSAYRGGAAIMPTFPDIQSAYLAYNKKE